MLPWSAVEDHDGIVAHAELIQCGQHAAHLFVHERHAPLIVRGHFAQDFFVT